MNVGAYAFSYPPPFLFILDPSPYNGGATHIQGGLPRSVKPLWQCPHRHAQSCTLGDSKSSQVGHKPKNI